MEINMYLFPKLHVVRATALWALCSSATLLGGTKNSISATASGTIFNVSSDDLSAGAGSEICNAKVLPGTFDLDLGVIDEQKTWEVDVHLGSSSWPENLVLFTRIIANGSPTNSTIQGGTDWITLSSTPQILCTGVGSTSGIGLEFMVGNLSLANCPPADSNYSQWLNFSLGAP